MSTGCAAISAMLVVAALHVMCAPRRCCCSLRDMADDDPEMFDHVLGQRHARNRVLDGASNEIARWGCTTCARIAAKGCRAANDMLWNVLSLYHALGNGEQCRHL